MRPDSSLAALFLASLSTLELLAPAAAAPPARSPVLRIETGMHTAPIHSIAADKAGSLLVTASADKTARVWDMTREGALRTVFRPPIGEGREGALYGVAMTRDGQMVATGGDTGSSWDRAYSVYLFRSSDGELIRRLTGFPSSISELAFSPDERRLAVCMRAGARIVDTTTGAVLADYRPPAGECSYVDMALDGRVVTSWTDGHVRLHDGNLGVLGEFRTERGDQPVGVRFSPDGQEIAVGHARSAQVSVLSVEQGLRAIRLRGEWGTAGGFENVSWWPEQNALCAGGSASLTCFSNPGVAGVRGIPSVLGPRGVGGLVPVSGGQMAIVNGAPMWATIDRRGKFVQAHPGSNFDFGPAHDCLSANRSLTSIAVCHVKDRTHGEKLVFDVAGRAFSAHASKEFAEHPQLRSAYGLEFDGFGSRGGFRINGQRIAALDDHIVFSVDILGESRRFMLGTNKGLMWFASPTQILWQVATAAPALGVLGSLDGTRLVAAHSDGTIRWYSAADGRELLALFASRSGTPSDPLPWVLWTPAGYYDASPQGEQLVAFQRNRGADAAAELLPARQLAASYRRPDIISRALSRNPASDASPTEWAAPEVVAEPAAAPAPSRAKPGSGAELSPKPRLHVLAIGISRYQQPDLNGLKYPATDAEAIVQELRRQGEGLYQEVKTQVLRDQEATFTRVRGALQALAREAAEGDVSIIYLAGHGQLAAKTDEYFFPMHDYAPGQEVNSALYEQELRTALRRISGKRIMILDTCHAGQTGRELAYRASYSPRIERLTHALAAAGHGTVVMAGAKANQLARETQELGHGAFTAALLEGLRGCPVAASGPSMQLLQALRQQDAVQVSSLHTYVSTRVRELTQNEQSSTLFAEPNGFDFPVVTFPQQCPTTP